MEDKRTDDAVELGIGEAEDVFECAHVDINDELLSKSRIFAYMFGQQVKGDDGEEKPFNPKTFPQKAIDIMIVQDERNAIEIFLDTTIMMWDSKFKAGGRPGKLGPDQMEKFFNSDFYRKMLVALSERWPLSDPLFRKYFDACVEKRVSVGPRARREIEEVNQPGKRKDLANKDVTGDGVRDYSTTGRKIQTFGDMGVKGSSGRYYCWPNPKFPFKWSQWKDWKKIKPLCKLNFVHNNREYGISLSPYDTNYNNRGFRGYDVDWTPPLAWLTPGECEQVMKLNIVKKFVRKCIKRIVPYLRMGAEEIYENINNKDKITVEEIRKTQRILKKVVNVALRKNKADNYCWED